ncbi:hypothetical protein K7432_018507, partial [Basidiobolus ranarum]
MSFIKRSTKRQIRKKIEVEEEEEPEPVIVQRSKPKVNKAKKITPSLSFDDDEEGESLELKKSSASLEVKKAKTKKFQLRGDAVLVTPEPVVSERPSYSKEYLEALKKESFNPTRAHDKFDLPEGIPDEHLVLLAKK